MYFHLPRPQNSPDPEKGWEQMIMDVKVQMGKNCNWVTIRKELHYQKNRLVHADTVEAEEIQLPLKALLSGVETRIPELKNELASSTYL